MSFIKKNINKKKSGAVTKVKLLKFRSSRPEVFRKKGVLRNFAKFTGKHLCQRLFFFRTPPVAASENLRSIISLNLEPWY